MTSGVGVGVGGIGRSGLEFEEKHWVHNSRIGVFNRVDLEKPISIPQLLL